MARQGKAAKAGASGAPDPHKVVKVTLNEGDWLDVMDAEGTWNVAQVLGIAHGHAVEVKYDGWGAEFNEVIPLNSLRIAPYNTYTWSVTCWAKYGNWPWWPSIVTIRSPGSLAGQAYLQKETRLFVDFLDASDISKRCRCWVEMNKVKPFKVNYDMRRKQSTGSDFEASLARALQSTATSTFPSFTKGTLPATHKTRVAESVQDMKRQIGLPKWVELFHTNRARHCDVYQYSAMDGVSFADKGGEEEDDDDGPVVQFTGLSDEEDDRFKRFHAKGRGKARATPKKAPGGGSRKLSIKREMEFSDPVVRIEDSANIIEGPHAPSPKREMEEQPLYLPPLDEHPDEEQVPPDVKPRRLRARTAVKVVSAPKPNVSVSVLAEEVEVSEAPPDTSNAVLDKVFEVDSAPTVGAGVTSVEENSEGPQVAGASSSGVHDIVAVVAEQTLAMDLEVNDESDDKECDSIHNKPTSEKEPAHDPRGSERDPVPELAASTREDFSASATIQTATSNPTAPVINEATGSAEGVMEAEAMADTPPSDGANVASSHSVIQSSEDTDSVGGQEERDEAPKRSKANRRKLKSLADESIAAAQAALAELEDRRPAPPKKRRTVKGGSASSKKKTPALTKPSAPQEKETLEAKRKSAPVKNATEALVQSETVPSTEDNIIKMAEAVQERVRRSSMRAGVGATGQSKSLSKTPVWVLPPPKFDDASLNVLASPVSASSILSSPAFPPPFSSLSLFGSTVDFSLSKWFKQDKYPHYLAK